MLRMVLLGLLIPLGVGVLSAMELRTPPRSTAAVVQPVAETTAGHSDSHGALAKADRLEVAVANTETPVQQAAAVRSETPVQPAALADEPVSPPEGVNVGSSEPPRLINAHRHESNSKKITTAARPTPKKRTSVKTASVKTAPVKAAASKASAVKRTALSQRSKDAGDSEPCRLKAFGGLLKALNTTDCQI